MLRLNQLVKGSDQQGRSVEWHQLREQMTKHLDRSIQVSQLHRQAERANVSIQRPERGVQRRNMKC